MKVNANAWPCRSYETYTAIPPVGALMKMARDTKTARAGRRKILLHTKLHAESRVKLNIILLGGSQQAYI